MDVSEVLLSSIQNKMTMMMMMTNKCKKIPLLMTDQTMNKFRVVMSVKKAQLISQHVSIGGTTMEKTMTLLLKDKVIAVHVML